MSTWPTVPRSDLLVLLDQRGLAHSLTAGVIMFGVAGNSGRPGASVTSRALALIGAFDERHRRLTLSELAARSGVPVSTAHRLVAELVTWGALTRTPAGDYVVGRRLWDIGMLAPVQTGILEIASPYLHDIYAATRATVHLAVRDGESALYLDRLSGHSSVPVVSKVGGRLPLHATGVGKVLLAHAPAEVRAAVLRNLTRHTAQTITQPGLLGEQLARIVEIGHATTVEEMTLGASSVAVPVWHRERVVAALGVVVPDFTRELPRLLAALQVAAGGVGRALSVQ